MLKGRIVLAENTGLIDGLVLHCKYSLRKHLVGGLGATPGIFQAGMGALACESDGVQVGHGFWCVA